MVTYVLRSEIFLLCVSLSCLQLFPPVGNASTAASIGVVRLNSHSPVRVLGLRFGNRQE